MTYETLRFIPTTGNNMFNAAQNQQAGMRKNLLAMVLGLALPGLAVLAGTAAAAPMKSFHGQVPAVVSKLQPLASLPDTNVLRLGIGLPLRNREALTNLLREVYDPASTNYHRYLTPEEFTARFGPTEEDYQKVIDFAQANGLTVVKTHANRVLVDVRGQVGNVNKALHIKLHTYRHPKEARDFFAPDTEPTVDATLPILDFSGLNNYVLPRPMLHQVAPGAVPGRGSGPRGGYIGADFRKAYIPGSTLNGAGQIVGLLQFDGYFASDIAAYVSQAGQTNVPLENVLLDGFDGTPGFNNGEVCLDIETVIAMAPALVKVVVFEGYYPNSILSAMASRSEIKQFSASWGYYIDATSEQLYQQLALQGQTFFNASGDGDAWVNPDWPILFPCLDDPYITIVGGTTLTMNGNADSYASETVWNWGFIGDYNWNPYGYFGSSGGISAVRPIPSYQTNINYTANHGSTTMRNVPDVALTADNVYVTYDGGSQGLFGGTSCASPLWAGFMALVNQQAAAKSIAPPGFINPAVYAIAAGTNYTSAFHDTTTGNNAWPLSGGLFNAVAGYDLCTGLGTPNGTNFINALVVFTNSVVRISPPLPPYGTTLAALNGGNPNGSWQLFVQDSVAVDQGTNYNGWVLTLTTANPVGTVCDLELSLVASATNVLTGNTLAYVIGVTNYGVSAATNVKVTVNLQGGISNLVANPTQGSVTGLVWTVGTLANSAGARLTLTLQPTTAGTIDNYSVASTATPDPNPDDDFKYVSVNVAAATPPQFGTARVVNGQFILSISGPPASTIVQMATNLVSPSWMNVYTGTPPLSYTNRATNPASFYRAVLGP